MAHTVYVTRTASVTYVAEVDLPLDEIKARCGKYGFDDEGLELDWDVSRLSAFDSVEAYQITHEVARMIENKRVIDEVTDAEWELN